MSVQAIRTQLATLQTAAFPTYRVHGFYPESIAQVPALVNLPTTGTRSYDGFVDGLDADTVTIRTDLLYLRAEGGTLAKADERLWSTIDAYLAFCTTNWALGGAVNSTREVTWEYGAVLSIAGIDYLANRFTQVYRVKELSA